MNVKVNLPESIEDITLNQYQKYIALTKREDLDDLSFNKRLISIFTNLKFRDVERISFKDYEVIVAQILVALSQEVEFKDIFVLNDVEFRFIPNLDEITMAEYVDLSTHGMEVESLHKVMAVLFRPVKGTDPFGNYTIEHYNGTSQYAEAMKFMPLSIVNGALVFFYNLSKELRSHIQRSTQVLREKVKRQQDSSANGDGTQL